MTASGYTGTILRWEESTDGGASWGRIDNVSETYDPPSVSTTTLFRVAIINTSGASCISYSDVATISVGASDVTAPVADAATLADVTAQCEVTSLTAPTATDNCDGSITGTHNATLPITTQGTTTVTWTYADAQGNSSTQTQDVVIDDNTAPVADVATLSDITAQCSVASLTAPTATDNCDGSITGMHNATLPITTQGTTTVTWTYTDAAGNTSTQAQEVVIDDVTDPVLNAPPADVTVACLGDLPAMVDLAWTDNCDGSGSTTGSDVNNGGGPITVTRTWTYTDAGGNTATQTQTITIANSFDVDDIAGQTVCDSYTLPAITGTNLSGNEAYYTGPNGTGISYASGDVISRSTTLYIFDEAGGCFDEEIFDIYIVLTPDVEDIANQIVCDSYTLPVITGSNLSGNEGYYTEPNGSGLRYSSGETMTTSRALYIYDVNGSCSDEENFIITVLSTPDVHDIEDKDICENYTLPVIRGENLTGNESYYSASGGNGDVYSAGEVITSTTTLYIYNENGTCSDEESFTINLRDAEVNLGDDVEICEGEEYTFSTDILYEAYLWNDVSNESEYTTGQEGYVWVEVTNEYSCTASDSVFLTVNSKPEVDLGSDTLLCGNESLEISAGDFSSYEWSTGDVSSRIIVYAGEQEIAVTVTDENDCTGSDKISIFDCEDSDLSEVTNVFTPNGDGVHDTWIINGIEMYPDVKIEVFDRSQRRVFFKSGNYNSSNAWDGTINGKELPMGNYYYIIDLYGDGEKIIKGYVTIVK